MGWGGEELLSGGAPSGGGDGNATGEGGSYKDEIQEEEKDGGNRIIVLESLPAWPCFADWELRSRSACLAMARGSWSLYSADMVC